MTITELNKVVLIGALTLIGGCACIGGAAETANAMPMAGTLHPVWLESSAMRVDLDDKHFLGEQSSSVCHTDACRSVFRNVPRIYRRHVLNGQAELVAPGGERLSCEWTRYRDQVDGVCRDPDGRQFKLMQD